MAFSFRKGVLIVFSAALTALPFHFPGAYPCIAIGLVPFFFSIQGISPSRAAGYGFLWGIVFFSSTLYWLCAVTVTGAISLWIYLALYPAACAFVLAKKIHAFSLFRALFAASAWTAFEYIRASLFTGFGWVLLGYAPWKAPFFLQVAKVGGVWLVSFFIALINVLAFYWLRYRGEKKVSLTHRACAFLGVTIAVFFLANMVIYHSLPAAPCGKSLRVALIQPNIAQNKKWDPSCRTQIFDVLTRLTKEAAAARPDMIIWPEAALPGFLEYDEDIASFFSRLIDTVKIPILTGAVTASYAQGKNRYYNSALLFYDGKGYAQKYDKIHLVPFGEYIPFYDIFPFLERLPRFNEIGNFSAGTAYTVFMAQACPFSVLICFEDAVVRLAQEFVRKGAHMLVVITNDAWFGDTAAPYQHAQASILRSIENGVWVLRAANTGFSCVISPQGEIVASVSDASGRHTFIEGYCVGDIPCGGRKMTWYTRYGDWVIVVALLIMLYGTQKYRA